uniref:Putative secreted peptide n=1 Tax=Anopheles braziliensis TaxID=58242 RepID=A0A2M3ZTI0_9DIPT
MRWVVLGLGDDVAAAIKSLLHLVLHQHLLPGVAWCAIDETVSHWGGVHTDRPRFVSLLWPTSKARRPVQVTRFTL